MCARLIRLSPAGRVSGQSILGKTGSINATQTHQYSIRRSMMERKRTHIGMTSHVTRTVHVKPNMAIKEKRR